MTDDMSGGQYQAGSAAQLRITNYEYSRSYRATQSRQHHRIHGTEDRGVTELSTVPQRSDYVRVWFLKRL